MADVLSFLAAHYLVAALLVLVAGVALSMVVAAPFDALAKIRRPGDCPRCNGTGREPKGRVP